MQQTVPDPVFVNVEYIFFLIYRAVSRVFSFLFGDDFYGRLKIIATLIVIALITIILYCLVRLYELEQEGKTKTPAVATATALPLGEEHHVDRPAIGRNELWESVRTRILSDNPSDWRLAIIEADIYLDKVLDQKGIFGDTLGDKLKQVMPEKLPSIQLAWEAHKVRNRIAHEGAEFTLTQPEARRVLSYFEIVFRDLEVIA